MMARLLPESARRDERQRRLRARNWTVLALLLALVALIYVISIVRMSGG